MKKEDVLKYMREAVDTLDKLKDAEPLGEEHTTWLLTTKDLLREVFGEGSDFYKHFSGISYELKGDSRFDAWYYKYEAEKMRRDVYLKGLAQAKGVLRSALTHIERFGLPKEKK